MRWISRWIAARPKPYVSAVIAVALGLLAALGAGTLDRLDLMRDVRIGLYGFAVLMLACAWGFSSPTASLTT